MPKKDVLLDANAIIFLHSSALWKPVLNAYNIAVTSIIRKECRFYKDMQGQKKSIDLSEAIQKGDLKEIAVSVAVFDNLRLVLKETFLLGIDNGEREAIAWLYENRRQTLYRFCTADALAVKCLGVLGLRYHGISIQELLDTIHIHFKIHPSHSKQYFEKMLSEGFLESNMHKMQPV